jgi:FkbM family methyltransferase
MYSDKSMLQSFIDIQKIMLPSLSIEIGAYDADFSKSMVGIAKEIWAFEASPYVYEKFKDIEGVNYINLAISNKSGLMDFEIQQNEHNLIANNSIMKRNDNTAKQYIPVESKSLNDLFKDRKNIALWIDCEGANEQVLTGASEILPNVQSIFIEVETVRFWKNQWLENDVKSYLENFGFKLSLSQPQYVNQYNQIYIK